MEWYNGYSPQERNKKLRELHKRFPNRSHPHYSGPCHMSGEAMKGASAILAVVVLSTAGCCPLSRQVSQKVQEQEAVTVFAQLPTAQWGGYYSSAEPHEPTGGVSLVTRAADDFTVERAISVSVVTWWGGSSDGYHHEIDTIDQVSAFLVEIFGTDAETQSIGPTLRREIFGLADTHPVRTNLKMYAGSDVFCHTVELRKPFIAYPGRRYWLSVSAYLHAAPMWVWFKSDERNRNAVVDLGVDGIWNDEPKENPWTEKLALAFELRGVPVQARSE